MAKGLVLYDPAASVQKRVLGDSACFRREQAKRVTVGGRNPAPVILVHYNASRTLINIEDGSDAILASDPFA